MHHARNKSDWVDVQAILSQRWTQSQKVTFTECIYVQKKRINCIKKWDITWTLCDSLHDWL